MSPTSCIMYLQGGRHMKQTKVMSVFDGIEMQKYFLFMTKQAEEAAYKAFMQTIDSDVNISVDDFLKQIKEEPKLKLLIQDMIISSIANIDWDYSVQHILCNN